VWPPSGVLPGWTADDRWLPQIRPIRGTLAPRIDDEETMKQHRLGQTS